MTVKKTLSNHLRGWLPKEFAAAATPQKSAAKYPPLIRWTARALVAGAVATAALLVLGDLGGLTRGVGGYLWYVAVEGAVWGGVAAVPFLIRHKEKHQRGTQI